LYKAVNASRVCYERVEKEQQRSEVLSKPYLKAAYRITKYIIFGTPNLNMIFKPTTITCSRPTQTKARIYEGSRTSKATKMAGNVDVGLV